MTGASAHAAAGDRCGRGSCRQENLEALRVVQRALLIVCLDHLAPANDDEYARLLLHAPAWRCPPLEVDGTQQLGGGKILRLRTGPEIDLFVCGGGSPLSGEGHPLPGMMSDLPYRRINFFSSLAGEPRALKKSCGSDQNPHGCQQVPNPSPLPP